MKLSPLPIVAVVVFGAGFLAGGWYYPRERIAASPRDGRTVVYYVDPMHPAYRSDRPGQAPDCGMTLEPVYADEGGDAAAAVDGGKAGAVRISAERQQWIGVRVAPAERTGGTSRLRLYGRVAADETTLYRVDAGVDGFVRDVAPVTTGAQVARDQWLATISAPDLRAPIQAYLVSVDIAERAKAAGESPAQLDALEATLQQSIDRLLTIGLSLTQLDEIRRTRVVPTSLRVTAPGDGVVMGRSVALHQRVRRGEELFHIADLRRVWILADIAPADARHVRPGSAVRVATPGGGASMTGRISDGLPPQFDPQAQSTLLRIEVANGDYVLRPDMFVDVEVPIARPPALTVPADAVIDSGASKVIYVDRGEGVFEPRDVRIGARYDGRVEVVDGLQPGERIAVSGVFLLDSESRLHGRPIPSPRSQR